MAIANFNSIPIEIVGAGPSGLSAALAARVNGYNVVVYEQFSEVGKRFHGDFQGLENWTHEVDVLEELLKYGISIDFEYKPIYEIACFDRYGCAQLLRATKPIFYLIHRGSQTGSLDQALKAQALDAGVSIQFGHRKRQLTNGGVVAGGPHRADIIAVGYTFETDMADGCYVAIGEELAPGGYSYLIVNRGRGTLASCMFEDFHNERKYLESSVEYFQKHAGLRWSCATRFGGRGNYGPVHSQRSSERLYVGETAGFQDALFGFGLRYALISGNLAGKKVSTCMSSRSDYKRQEKLDKLVRSSIGNRWIYSRTSERWRHLLLDFLVYGRDPRRTLTRIYRPTWWKSIIANYCNISPLVSVDQVRVGCDCTWCRCQGTKEGKSN